LENKEPAAILEAESAKPSAIQALNLNFSASSTVSNVFLFCINFPVYGILLQQQERTQDSHYLQVKCLLKIIDMGVVLNSIYKVLS
jgi:hypothetical protein